MRHYDGPTHEAHVHGWYELDGEHSGYFLENNLGTVSETFPEPGGGAFVLTRDYLTELLESIYLNQVMKGFP